MVQSKLEDNEQRLRVVFFKTARGNEPVREWLKELENHWKDSRKLPDSSDVARLFAEFAALMEQARTAKAEKTEGKGLKSGKRS